MAEELTQEQLLLLDNMMYIKDITDEQYCSVAQFIQYYENGKINLTGANLSGGFEKNDETIQNMKDVLDAIADDPQLMAKEYVD